LRENKLTQYWRYKTIKPLQKRYKTLILSSWLIRYLSGSRKFFHSLQKLREDGTWTNFNQK